MKKPICFLSLLFIFNAIVFSNLITFAADSNTDDFSKLKTLSLSELQQDYQQFKNTIMLEHPKLFADKAGLEASINEQYQKIKDNMNELEFSRILAPVISKLNCGHTRLQFSPEFESILQRNGRYLPLRVKIIENKAYVWRNLGNPEIPASSEILAINQRPVSEIISILLNNQTADGLNLSKKYYEMNHWFSELYFSYIEAAEKYRISFIKPGAKSPTEVILNAVPKAQLDYLIRLADPSDELIISPQFTKDYAALIVRTFGFYDAEDRNRFERIMDGFFQELTQSKTKNLLLDLRDNWGGDPYCSAYLFRHLIIKPCAYFAPESPYYSDLKQPLKPAQNNFQGNLYVLINGASFSSTGHLCSLLKYYKIGTFIGQETGGSYVCTDGSRDITLQNTKLRFHYSTMAFKTAVFGLTPGRGIMPDYPVNPTIENYINNEDVEKDFAIDLIQKNQAVD